MDIFKFSKSPLCNHGKIGLREQGAQVERKSDEKLLNRFRCRTRSRNQLANHIQVVSERTIYPDAQTRRLISNRRAGISQLERNSI